MQLGLPLLLKAAAGGGGRGMRLVRSVEELPAALESASAEAMSAFGDGRIFAERYLERAHHIEIQVIGDASGRVQAVGERECSVQRRHQKVVEECPSPSIDTALRERLAADAVRLCTAAGYRNAGSVEFLVLPERHESFFLEVNTRLQVEHPVTEEVAGIDLVEMQLRAAAGERLPDLGLRPDRHAVEFRVYAEDVLNEFRPSAGKLARYAQPAGEGIRVDSGIDDRSSVSSAYDPLLAKLIAYGPTRADALARGRQALDRFAIRGVQTNLPLLRAVARAGAFEDGRAHVQWLEQDLPSLLDEARTPTEALAALGAFDADGRWPADAPAPWGRLGPWRAGPAHLRYRDDLAEAAVTVVQSDGGRRATAAGQTMEVALHDGWTTVEGVDFDVRPSGGWVTVSGGGRSWLFERATLPPPESFRSAAATGSGVLVAPLHGMVERVLVAPGDGVEALQPLVILVAMKMEHVIAAPAPGTVEHVLVRPGEQVTEGQELVRLRL